MKKTPTPSYSSIPLFLLFFCFSFSLKAQLTTNYTLASGKYDTVGLATAPLNLPQDGAPISGGTTLASGGPGSKTTDNIFTNVPIGFEFKFNGKFYSSIGISSNGFAWFGNTAPAANEYNPVSDNFGSEGVISVFGASIQGRNYVSKTGQSSFVAPTSTIKYETIGTAPNQIFIVNWNNFAGKSLEDTLYNDTTQDYNNYRMDLYLVLYQCSYVVEPLVNNNVYPWFSLGGARQMTGECGLRGHTNADFFNTNATCQNVGGSGFQDLVPSGPTGSNATTITLSTASCLIGTIYITLDFSNPLFFDIEGGNPQAWIYTPTSFHLTSSTAAPNPVCNSTPVTVTVNASGGTAPYAVTWTATGAGAAPANGNSSGITSFPDNSISTSFNSAGSGSFNFTYTDSVDCPATGTAGPITVNSCTTNTITTGTVVGSPFCACGPVSVPFTSVGTFNTGNVYTVQISDSTGNFTNATNIGTSASTANSGTISATIPCNIPTGHGYRIRVISSNPGTTGTDNGVDLVVNGTNPPSLNIFVSPTLVCSGGTVHCTATAQNGVSPHFQWLLNGQPAGTDSTGFTTVLTNGTTSDDSAFIQCVMTTNTNCTSGVIDSSNKVTVTVSSVSPSAVTISASPGTSICPGQQVTFTATPVNGGPTPTYQWFVNGIAAGNGITFTSNTLNNGDSVYCVITSSNFCANPGTGTSAALYITSAAPITPAVTIVASQTSICSGTNVIFAPTPVNGGSAPTYEWQIDGAPVSSDSVFSTTTLADNDTVNCIMTSNLGCVTTATATSNSIVIKVVGAPVLTISPVSPITECTGTPVQITVSGADTFKWSPPDGLSCIDCPNPFVDATVSTLYTVTGSVNNCKTSDSVVVVVHCPGNFVPTAFSPNGDGINDVLTVLGPSISNFNFKIFDRWGELLFEANDQDFGWDGTYKGVKVSMGVYVWELSGIDKTGNKVLVQGKNSGTVTLLR